MHSERTTITVSTPILRTKHVSEALFLPDLALLCNTSVRKYAKILDATLEVAESF